SIDSRAIGDAGDHAHTLAVVPLRDGHSGKSRLASMASPSERTAIIGALAHHVCGRLIRTPQIAEVLVVTNATDFARDVLPADAKITIAQQPDDRPGLNNAAMLGIEHGRSKSLERVLTIHADLPILAVADVTALVTARGDLVLGPDRYDNGTNAIVVNSALAGFEFLFGPASFQAHLRLGERLDAHTVVVRRDGLALDLDTADDWRALPDSVRGRLAPLGHCDQ